LKIACQIRLIRLSHWALGGDGGGSSLTVGAGVAGVMLRTAGFSVRGLSVRRKSAGSVSAVSLTKV